MPFRPMTNGFVVGAEGRREIMKGMQWGVLSSIMWAGAVGGSLEAGPAFAEFGGEDILKN